MRVRWLQQDWIRAAGPEPVVYVFDTETVAGYGLKRIGFLYECLLELDVEVRKGRYEEEVLEFCRRLGAAEVVTTETADPLARRAIEILRRAIPVAIEPIEPFVSPGRALDLKRFSRYWSRVEPLLLPAGRKAR